MQTEQLPDRGRVKVHLHVEARDPCPVHKGRPCECEKPLVGVYDGPDLATKQFSQLIQLNILATNETIKDTSAVNNAETANAAASAPTILAGTGSTAATVGDNAMQTQTETVAGTVTAYVGGAGTSGTFTVTGTITAGADRAYAEVGLRCTVNAHLYLICHDVFSVLNVSSSGTLAVTYTITDS